MASYVIPISVSISYMALNKVHDTQRGVFSLFDVDTPNLRMIEGVSNEVTVFFTAVLVLIVTIFYIRLKEKRQRQPSSIHPQLLSDIEDFRQIFARANAPMPDDASIQRLRAARERSDRNCPICFGDASYPILTNCGHLFCCECIIGYWRHSTSLLTPVTCAICRTTVTMLLPIDWPRYVDPATTASAPSVPSVPSAPPIEGDDEDGLIQRNETLHENNIRLNDYNRRFSGERPWLEYIYDLPVLIPYAFRNLTDFSGLGLLFRVRVIVCVLTVGAYILTPFDIFPESVFGVLGLLDDIFVIVLMLVYFAIIIRQFMSHRGEAHVDNFLD